jgi:SAM-dependent methyltransferase
MKNEHKPVSFDAYVETYQKEIQRSIGFIRQDVDFFIELKAGIIKKLALKNFRNPAEIKILDIGSGVGLTDSHLSGFFRNLHGVDVEEGVVQKAKERNPSVCYQLYNGLNLPFGDNFFDMVFTINVMHHVKPSGWSSFLNEARRVLKPGGKIAVFEHNPINPLTRLAVSRCEFDRDAALLRKGLLKNLFMKSMFVLDENAYIVFFPFRNKIFRSAELFLRWLPLGAQYYITGTK